MKKSLLLNLIAVLVHGVIIYTLQLFFSLEVSFLAVILFAIIELHVDIYLKK